MKQHSKKSVVKTKGSHGNSDPTWRKKNDEDGKITTLSKRTIAAIDREKTKRKRKANAARQKEFRKRIREGTAPPEIIETAKNNNRKKHLAKKAKRQQEKDAYVEALRDKQEALDALK